MQCQVEDNFEIVIRIAVDALPAALALSNYINQFDPETMNVPTVTDPLDFAVSVVDALTEEREDGSTLLTLCIDRAMAHVCEQGWDGVQ